MYAQAPLHLISGKCLVLVLPKGILPYNISVFPVDNRPRQP